MEMVVDFPSGARVDAHFGPFTISTDQPPAGGGEGAYPTPFATFLASLATCAGIYVLDPSIMDLLPTENGLDMPELFQIVMENNRQATVFPIREYWIDIGRVDDYEKANGDYVTVFK